MIPAGHGQHARPTSPPRRFDPIHLRGSVRHERRHDDDVGAQGPDERLDARTDRDGVLQVQHDACQSISPCGVERPQPPEETKRKRQQAANAFTQEGTAGVPRVKIPAVIRRSPHRGAHALPHRIVKRHLLEPADVPFGVGQRLHAVDLLERRIEREHHGVPSIGKDPDDRVDVPQVPGKRHQEEHFHRSSVRPSQTHSPTSLARSLSETATV